MVLAFIIALSGSAALAATSIDIDPDSLNLESKGKWITCYILDAGTDPTGIDDPEINAIDGNSVGPIVAERFGPGDYDGDGTDDCLMAKFSRADVEDAIKAEGTIPGMVEIQVEFDGGDYTNDIYAFSPH